MSSNSTSSGLIHSPQVEIRRHEKDRPWTYSFLDSYQRTIAKLIRDEGAKGRLILSELAPVITRGQRLCEGDFIFSEAEIRAAEIEILRTDRGGRTTYHGPGQWVVFVVERLDRLTGDPRGVRKATEALLRAALRVCQQHMPESTLRSGDEVGVWSSMDPSATKLVSLGVKIEKGVLLHGLCFNGFQTKQSFFGIKPCGLDVKPGFLLPREDPESFQILAQSIIQSLRQEFPVFD